VESSRPIESKCNDASVFIINGQGYQSQLTGEV